MAKNKLVKSVMLSDRVVRLRLARLRNESAAACKRHEAELDRLSTAIAAIQARCSHSETKDCYGQYEPSYTLCLVCGLTLE